MIIFFLKNFYAVVSLFLYRCLCNFIDSFYSLKKVSKKLSLTLKNLVRLSFFARSLRLLLQLILVIRPIHQTPFLNCALRPNHANLLKNFIIQKSAKICLYALISASLRCVALYVGLCSCPTVAGRTFVRFWDFSKLVVQKL